MLTFAFHPVSPISLYSLANPYDPESWSKWEQLMRASFSIGEAPYHEVSRFAATCTLLSTHFGSQAVTEGMEMFVLVSVFFGSDSTIAIPAVSRTHHASLR